MYILSLLHKFTSIVMKRNTQVYDQLNELHSDIQPSLLLAIQQQ